MKKGRPPPFGPRCAAGVSFAVGIALVFSALQMALCGALYGMDGFAAPLQLWVEGSFSALHVSMGQLSLILLGLLVLACGMAAVFVMLLSELFGTAIPALVVPFALSAASILELFMGNGRWMEQAASYLPFFRVSADTLQDYYPRHPWQSSAQQHTIQRCPVSPAGRFVRPAVPDLPPALSGDRKIMQGTDARRNIPYRSNSGRSGPPGRGLCGEDGAGIREDPPDTGWFPASGGSLAAVYVTARSRWTPSIRSPRP